MSAVVANPPAPSPADDQRENERPGTSSGSPEHAGGREKDSPAVKENGKSNGETPDGGKSTKKRRKVNHACVYCRRSHMTCDQNRPCSRCIKRDIGHLCHDEPREPKRSRNESDGQGQDNNENSPVPEARIQSEEVKPDLSVSDPLYQNSSAGATDPLPTGSRADAAAPFSSTDQQMYTDWNNPNSYQFQNIHSFHPNYMFNTSEAGNEYSLINDFITNSLMDDSVMYTTGEDPQSLFADPSFANIMGPLSTNEMFPLSNSLPPPSQGQDGTVLQRPPTAARLDKAQEKYYMEAADPTGQDSPEERMNKLLKAKYDAGLLKPFNYVKGYARLNQYMEKHLHPMSRNKILRQLEAFRPKFRERMQSLTDLELIRVEMWFEMKLMEYDRVFASMAIPACCWRRTGEIFRGNREMAELIGVPLEQLREGKLAIHDMICEDSLVMYWTKFGQIAFDLSKKAMLASCNLKRPNGPAGPGAGLAAGSAIRCCFSFTVQRDEHTIPSIITGNFLPIVNVNGDGVGVGAGVGGAS